MDRLSCLVVGAAVVGLWLLVRRLRHGADRPTRDAYRCRGCGREFPHDERTLKAWRRGNRRFYCPACHAAWHEARKREYGDWA